MKNCLILNSCSNYPKIIIYFLGHWCLQDRKDSFKDDSKFNIISSELSDKEFDYYIKDLKIYKNLINDITIKLNSIHNTFF